MFPKFQLARLSAILSRLPIHLVRELPTLCVPLCDCQFRSFQLRLSVLKTIRLCQRHIIFVVMRAVSVAKILQLQMKRLAIPGCIVQHIINCGNRLIYTFIKLRMSISSFYPTTLKPKGRINISV